MSEALVQLPQPLGPEFWPASLREDAEALWNWHLTLATSGLDVSDLERAAAQMREGGTPAGPLAGPASEALDVCRRRRLPESRLASQLEAAARRRTGIRFQYVADLNAFVDSWAGAHGLLLAGLADATHSWQQPMVREVSRGFFHTSRLADLKADLHRDQLFLPLEDLEMYGASETSLAAGKIDESVRKLLWKQIVRARDALARGQDLAFELPRRLASAYKKCWFGCLEVLGEIERRGYDVWSAPITLGRRQRAQVWYQSKFGRTTFRSK